jgi:hypothetical protein
VPGGLAGLEKWWRDFRREWEDTRVQADECREVDGEDVLVLTSYTGQGKGSGLELGRMGAKGAWLFHVRTGKVTKLVRYWKRERALSDLGLEE